MRDTRRRVEAAVAKAQTACQSTASQGCMRDSLQQKLAERLLGELPKLTAKQFEKACNAIQKSDPVRGPFAVAWLLSKAFHHKPPRRVQESISALSRDGAAMRKIQKANHSWGMSAWDVVHHKPERQMARYNSSPL